MNLMLDEKGVTFKELEKEIFKLVCEAGRELTKDILERYDQYLHTTRNKSGLRDKGCRRSTIKTVYGEVSYDRHVYQTCDEYRIKYCVYLLDENLSLNRIVLPISHTGVWNVVQSLGEKLEKD